MERWDAAARVGDAFRCSQPSAVPLLRMRATPNGFPACASPPTAATPSLSPVAGTSW